MNIVLLSCTHLVRKQLVIIRLHAWYHFTAFYLYFTAFISQMWSFLFSFPAVVTSVPWRTAGNSKALQMFPAGFSDMLQHSANWQGMGSGWNQLRCHRFFSVFKRPPWGWEPFRNFVCWVTISMHLSPMVCTGCCYFRVNGHEPTGRSGAGSAKKLI